MLLQEPLERIEVRFENLQNDLLLLFKVVAVRVRMNGFLSTWLSSSLA